MESVRLQMYFPGMKSKMISYVTSSEGCQRVKTGSKFKKGCKTLQPVDVPTQIWHICGIDLITNLPKMPGGYAALVTMINYKSKWVEAQSLESKHCILGCIIHV